jgi:anti-anti-sigma factor
MTAITVAGGAPTVVIEIAGRFGAEAEAELEDVLAGVRRTVASIIIDVTGVDHLDVEGVLVLAEHARRLRSRACTVVLRGAPSASEQLVRLLGYERALGLV